MRLSLMAVTDEGITPASATTGRHRMRGPDSRKLQCEVSRQHPQACGRKRCDCVTDIIEARSASHALLETGADSLGDDCALEVAECQVEGQAIQIAAGDIRVVLGERGCFVEPR